MYICLSPVETRVLFPINGIDWSECVEEMCPKYRRVLLIKIIIRMIMILMMMMITGEPRLPPSPPWQSWRS